MNYTEFSAKSELSNQSSSFYGMESFTKSEECKHDHNHHIKTQVENSPIMQTQKNDQSNNNMTEERNNRRNVKEWNYKTKGDEWKAFNKCEGCRQSPIALSTVNMERRYPQGFAFVFSDEEHVEVKQVLDNYLYRIDTELFYVYIPNLKTGYSQKHVMRQVHYHIPSEHTIDGQYADIEFHFVTENIDAEANSGDRYAVFGFLLKNDALTRSKLPRQLFSLNSNSLDRNSWKFAEQFFNLFNEDPFYFEYEGSLTTPPCSEQVRWFVYGRMLPIAYGDFFELFALIRDGQNVPDGNNRSLQEIGERKVYLNCYDPELKSNEEGKKLFME